MIDGERGKLVAFVPGALGQRGFVRADVVAADEQGIAVDHARRGTVPRRPRKTFMSGRRPGPPARVCAKLYEIREKFRRLQPLKRVLSQTHSGSEPEIDQVLDFEIMRLHLGSMPRVVA